MSFRTNGGVIDPTTHKEGSQMQFMNNPGPNERMNMRSTDRFFGATHEKDPTDKTGKRGGLVGHARLPAPLASERWPRRRRSWCRRST